MPMHSSDIQAPLINPSPDGCVTGGHTIRDGDVGPFTAHLGAAAQPEVAEGGLPQHPAAQAVNEGCPRPSSFCAPGTLASVQGGIPWRVCECGCGRDLTGRQKRFASRLCCSRWWDARNPRINRDPAGPRRAPLWKLALGILSDGEWHSAHDLALKLHADKHSIVARLSELQKRGHRIETDLPSGNSRRFHRYRLEVG